jgi:putative DNA primase/helicase
VRADTSKTDFASRIWKQSVPAIGSPVEAYLTGRDLELVPELSELGFHPHCPFKGEQVGALIAPMTDAVSGAFRGIHRTRLNPKDKAMLGPAKGAVVRLSPDDGVTDGLHICEGIETGLALLAMGFRPLWCALSAGGIARFPVLDGIEALTIFADRDANQAGEHAALDCADRWRAAGREVRILAAPEVGTDFADYRRAA